MNGFLPVLQVFRIADAKNFYVAVREMELDYREMEQSLFFYDDHWVIE